MERKDVIRINCNDPSYHNPVQIDIDGKSFSFQINNRKIYLSDIEAVWYRKGRNWLCDQFYPVTFEGYSKFTSYLSSKLKSEESKLGEYLHFIIENSVPTLGSSIKGNLNKLLVLRTAQAVGLSIPEFYVSNNKEGVKQIRSHTSSLITKSISDGIYLFENEESETAYFSYTEKADEEIINSLEDRFVPSLFQKNIAKKFEVRVFFLDDRCYSMAILSQSDQQTKTDFRKYNEKKPNRFVPFKLPEEVDQKIKRLFKKLELNTGSADLIVGQQNDFYFLEINPVGQFGMVSTPCNYFLEKQVASKLIAYAGRNRTL